MVWRPALFVFAVAITVVACRAHPDPASQRVIVETLGDCPRVSLEQSSGADLTVLEQACHGWSVEQCGDQMFFRTNGVRADEGKVVLRNGRLVDVAASIDAELGRGGEEYLHLRFLQPVCASGGLQLPFTGSRIGRDEQGSADNLKGQVRVTPDGAATVLLEH
jgi:hypothetical protein